MLVIDVKGKECGQTGLLYIEEVWSPVLKSEGRGFPGPPSNVDSRSRLDSSSILESGGASTKRLLD